MQDRISRVSHLFAANIRAGFHGSPPLAPLNNNNLSPIRTIQRGAREIRRTDSDNSRSRFIAHEFELSRVTTWGLLKTGWFSWDACASGRWGWRPIDATQAEHLDNQLLYIHYSRRNLNRSDWNNPLLNATGYGNLLHSLGPAMIDMPSRKLYERLSTLHWYLVLYLCHVD